MTLRQSLQGVTTTAVYETFALLFARRGLAHSVADDEDWVDALEMFRISNAKPPNRRDLRDAQGSLAVRLRGDVIRRIRQFAYASPVTIAVDGWTNVRHDKVTNVICLCGGSAYYWCSIVNKRSANTANWLTRPVLQVLNDVKSLGIAIVAVVMDNEEVNRKLHRRLVKRGWPSLLLSSCGAHTIQLCVKKALKLPLLRSEIVIMTEVLNKFSSTKSFRLRLKSLQEGAGVVEPLNLIKPNDTRWSSHLYAAQRLLKLKAWVQQIVPQREQFWSTLSSLVGFLIPFQVATDIIQADSSTLYNVHQQFSLLLRHIDKMSIESPLHPAKQPIYRIVQFYWKKFLNPSVVVSCAVFSFDEEGLLQFGAEQITTARNWFVDWAVDYLNFYHLSAFDATIGIKLALSGQYSDFLGRVNAFVNLSADIDVQRQQQANEKAMSRPATLFSSHHRYSCWDPKSVWYLYRQTAPELTAAVIALLSIAGSEAAVERTFTAQDACSYQASQRAFGRIC
jgi:hypothetical protein